MDHCSSATGRHVLKCITYPVWEGKIYQGKSGFVHGIIAINAANHQYHFAFTVTVPIARQNKQFQEDYPERERQRPLMKIWDWFQSSPFTKNLQFQPYLYETLSLLPTHELVILTKFHKIVSKIAEFLLVVSFQPSRKFLSLVSIWLLVKILQLLPNFHDTW